MCCSSESYPSLKLAKLLSRGLLLNTALLSAQMAFGQPESLPTLPQHVEYIKSGDAPIGDVANLRIPNGFRFADVKSAPVLLQGGKAAIPAGLAGLLTTDSGDW